MKEGGSFGYSPSKAAAAVILVVLIFSSVYILFREQGLVVLAFSFWTPLIPLRYVAWKLIVPHLRKHPGKIPSPTTMSLAYSGIFLMTTTLAIFGQHFLILWQLDLPWISTWIGILLFLLTFLAAYKMTRKIGWEHRTVAMPEFGSQPSPLVTDGIYAYTRHPEYLSDAMAIIGLLFITKAASLLLLLGLWALFIYPVISLEEKYLIERHGSDYRQYIRRTPRLIPSGLLVRRGK